MQALTFFFAFVAVLALIGVAAWLVRRFASNRLGANPNRSRMPRLAVIDAAAVDGRRRLVLVRRDNIEHLLMIGGPTDIVVEPNIVRAMPGRDQLPSRPAVSSPSEPQARIAPLPDAGSWGDVDSLRAEAFDHPEPQMPEPPPRPARPSFADEVRRPAAPERRIDRDPLTGFAPEPLGGRPEPRPELRGEPMPSRVTSRNEPPLMPRVPRPSEAPKPPPVRAPERTVAPPPVPHAGAGGFVSGPKSRRDGATAGSCPSPAGRRQYDGAARGARTASWPPGAPQRAPDGPAGCGHHRAKSGFENLEDEMASLLGRPKNPS